MARIATLAIPPAWTDVWICPLARGHIQATGRDAKGRKQYRYHDAWRRDRDGLKFERMIAFGRGLPRLRARVERDLARRGLPREKVIAAVVRLMELTLIRVGNEAYVKENKSFGLTTLRDRHAKLSGVGGIFEFRGKSGKVHKTGFRDRRLARIVKACQEVPGQRLFQYLDAEGGRRSVESADVNAYIRESLGGDFSAKDFRTWAGTLGAARALCQRPKATSATEAKRNVTDCVKAVASLLGNTAAVCRGSYIHPLVLEAYEQGALPLKPGRSPRAFELAVIRFLEAARASRDAC
jgi:DNA topoisomerase-1